MQDRAKICEKIHQMYPDMGECDKDLNVDWDLERDAWAVDFNKGPFRIRHYLEDEDAAACLEDDQCVGLGIEFAQFRW